MAAEHTALGRDEAEATARAADQLLELARGMAGSPRQTGQLREHSARLAAALEPYLRAVDVEVRGRTK
jgi:hypothetical protein